MYFEALLPVYLPRPSKFPRSGYQSDPSCHKYSVRVSASTTLVPPADRFSKGDTQHQDVRGNYAVLFPIEGPSNYVFLYPPLHRLISYQLLTELATADDNPVAVAYHT